MYNCTLSVIIVTITESTGFNKSDEIYLRSIPIYISAT